MASKELSDVDLILANTFTHQIWNNMPSDDNREELLRPYVLILSKDVD